jgi:hypothetical protein
VHFNRIVSFPEPPCLALIKSPFLNATDGHCNLYQGIFRCLRAHQHEEGGAWYFAYTNNRQTSKSSAFNFALTAGSSLGRWIHHSNTWTLHAALYHAADLEFHDLRTSPVSPSYSVGEAPPSPLLLEGPDSSSDSEDATTTTTSSSSTSTTTSSHTSSNGTVRERLFKRRRRSS